MLLPQPEGAPCSNSRTLSLYQQWPVLKHTPSNQHSVDGPTLNQINSVDGPCHLYSPAQCRWDFPNLSSPVGRTEGDAKVPDSPLSEITY